MKWVKKRSQKPLINFVLLGIGLNHWFLDWLFHMDVPILFGVGRHTCAETGGAARHRAPPARAHTITGGTPRQDVRDFVEQTGLIILETVTTKQ